MPDNKTIEEMNAEKLTEAASAEPVAAEEKKPAAKKTSSKKTTAKKPAAKKPTAKKPAAKKTAEIIIQSPLGGEISGAEILDRVGKADKISVRVDENKAYWVNGDETGSIDLW